MSYGRFESHNDLGVRIIVEHDTEPLFELVCWAQVPVRCCSRYETCTPFHVDEMYSIDTFFSASAGTPSTKGSRRAKWNAHTLALATSRKHVVAALR
jgi:hypothetical protein